MKIRKLRSTEEAPMSILLLADPSPSLIEDYLKRGECFVAEQDSQLVGACVLLPTRPGMMELVNLAVHEEFQSRGIGRQLLMHAIQHARREGYKSLEVGTGNSSLSQLGFYQKSGFRIVGVERDFFTNNYADTIFENGIQCRDMIRLSLELTEGSNQ